MVTIRQKVKKITGNQYMADPRQISFLEWYLDPKSETFSNGFKSAIKAGYSPEYAENLLGRMPTWLSEKVGELQMLSKAERNLNKILDLETREPIITMIGILKDKETDKVITKENPNLLRTQADVSKFIAERLGKKKYAERTENININVPAPIYNGFSVQGHNSEQKDIQFEEKNPSS